jgi:hypothetical protein
MKYIMDATTQAAAPAQNIRATVVRFICITPA